MTKKIRLIEEEEETVDLTDVEFQKKVFDYFQAMDWKLWEMLKIQQAWAEREGFLNPPPADDSSTITTLSFEESDFPQIIVDG